MVDHGPSDERAKPRPNDAIDPAIDDSPEAGRIELSKAPLVILILVFGGLLALAAAKIVVSENESERLDVTSGGGESSIEARDSGEAGGTGEAGGGDATTESAPGNRPLGDTQAMVETIAEGFVEDFSGLVDSDEALCMARTVVQMLGVERLWQMTEAMAEEGVEPPAPDQDDPRLLSREEEDRLNAALRPCVSAETADKLNFD